MEYACLFTVLVRLNLGAFVEYLIMAIKKRHKLNSALRMVLRLAQ